MSRWYEHPCTNKLLEGDQVLNVLRFLNEASECFKKHYGDPNNKESSLDDILKLWPDKSSVKREWLRRVLDNGPMNDKIQSMGTIISEFPMHALFYLDSLISMVNFNKKRFAIISSNLLTSIFVTYLLPKARPLLNVNERPLSMLNDLKHKEGKRKNKSAIPSREKILCHWYFEEQVKVRYVRFLNALEDLLKNEPDSVNKIKIIKLCFTLSQTKENQTVIIDMLVNKLGDQNKKVTGCAFSKLNEICNKNSLLMTKIVRSLRKFVFRPNLAKKAQYYAVQLLAHFQIDKKHLKSAPIEPIEDDNNDETPSTDNIAVEMVQIYIGIFKRLIDGSKSKCEKLYSAIMKGLSRAMPFTKGVDVQKYTDSVFQLVHSSNLNLSIHGLKVLYSIVRTKQDGGVVDDNEHEKDNYDRYMRLAYATLLNPSVFFNSQRVSLVDIFFKSVAIDNDTTRVKAMVKRLLQMCLHHPEPGFVCMCLLFLSRLTSSKHKSIFDRMNANPFTELKVPTINKAGETVEVDSDSGDEELPDIDSDKEDNDEVVKEDPSSTTVVKEATTTSWIHYDNRGKTVTKEAFYDVFARNPKYANAEREHLVELDLLKNHFHPSVRIFVEKIFRMERIEYKTDPCEDLSLAKFLDRFAYKNPKKDDNKRKHMPGSTKFEKDDVRGLSVNSKEFADLSEQRVPDDQLFFHKYFNHAKKNHAGNVPDDIDSDISDTEFDEYLLDNNKVDGDLFEADSEMGENDEEFEFSDLDEDFDMDDDEEEEENDAMSVDEDAGEDGDNSDGGDIDELGELDVDELGESDEQDDDDDDDSEEEETIHSSKRRRLGAELSTITTGALTLGKKFDAIKDRAANQIKHDRKKRKMSKNKSGAGKMKPKMKPKMKLGKRKFKK